MLKVGDTAPMFSGTDQRGIEFELSTLLERGPVVLYFYPKNFTRVCTQEACLFRDAYDDIKGIAAEVIGVSIDSDASHKKFADKHELGFPLISDKSREIGKNYGVLRAFGLITKRVTFVIGTDRRIKGVFHFEMSASRHVTEVNNLLKTLAA